MEDRILQQLVTFLVTIMPVEFLWNVTALAYLLVIVLVATLAVVVLSKMVFKQPSNMVGWVVVVLFILKLIPVWNILQRYYIVTPLKVLFFIWLAIIATKWVKWGLFQQDEKTGKFNQKSLYSLLAGQIFLLVVLILPGSARLAGLLAYRVGLVRVGGDEPYNPPAVSQPVKWSGPPLAEVPDGLVIPLVWNGIWEAVQLEGGNLFEATILYGTQRTECADPSGQCISSAGAEGWFQFMPGTWPTYADSDWSPYDLVQSARAAYRMFKTLRLFEQMSREAFQTRFSGMDGGLVWNFGFPGSAAYDGWDQAGVAWDSAQEIYASVQAISNTTAINGDEAVDWSQQEPQPELVEETAIRITLSSDVPPDQIYNVRLWAENNPVIEIAPGGSWDFCTQTYRTGWDGYNFAGGVPAGGICANSSMVWAWAQKVPGLVVVESTPHSPQGYTVFTHAVYCPGMTLTVRNNSGVTVRGRWVVDGDTLTLKQDTD